jgi:2',3'-cyclic-nucleotide 2'-phosphodiesterase/3'-nucleotidase
MYTMKLGGQEIKDFLEYSYGLWFNQMTGPKDYLLNFDLDENGNPVLKNGKVRLKNAFYNFDNAEGINYTVDISKPVGERVSIASMADGTPFDLNKTYTVAINSYRGNGGGGHLVAGSKIRQELLADRVITSTEKDFRFYLMEWIRENENINPVANHNWKLEPQDWVSQAATRDQELLFGK